MTKGKDVKGRLPQEKKDLEQKALIKEKKRGTETPHGNTLRPKCSLWAKSIIILQKKKTTRENLKKSREQ